MKIYLSIDYRASYGQSVCVIGSDTKLGDWDESKALALNCVSPSKWELELEIADDVSRLEYKYLVQEGGEVVRRESGSPHTLTLDKTKVFSVQDIWLDAPHEHFLTTSGFAESFFAHDSIPKIKYTKNTILLEVDCWYVKKGQQLILCGAGTVFGNWSEDEALRFSSVSPGKWQLVINATSIKKAAEYKLAIYDSATNDIAQWEEGQNRVLYPVSAGQADAVYVQGLKFRSPGINWRAAGVALPVFSLRTQDSFGIGEFSDLRLLVDWSVQTGQKVIQVLPINDTTITYTWTDSYPYNAISIYALHPIYLGLKDYPLKNKELYAKYKKQAEELNQLSDVDYDKVLILKWVYFQHLFDESGRDVLKSKDYLSFYKKNEEWLFPYACFSFLRDKYKTADYTVWKTFSTFDSKKLKKAIAGDKGFADKVDLLCFIQYLLHKQLVGVKEYAHKQGVILKGDIPIGISRNSVEAWVEPHLFNLDVQTGAPPDDFSIYGQNWGFPTYNWAEMAKDGYRWWTRRFAKMADYFDAYRIDHILGFFRIWEIPLSSVQGLLGYFSPALPLSVYEIESAGLYFDEDRMVKPYIHESFLGNIFGEYTDEVINKYFKPIEWQRFKLKDRFDTQVKIRDFFADKSTPKDMRIRDGLYSLCSEVLFIRDKYDTSKFHPRITAQYTYSYQHLDQGAKDAFNRLYDDFFYHRHSQFWRDEAMRKLPSLISSTSMLVCGEDLGMVPACVPSVMHDLQILSLEIERMSKNKDEAFNYLHKLPYLSVCTTSTHDMSPIRAWWEEDRALTQRYYNGVLWKQGEAPRECTPQLCHQIVMNHLNSPAMLVILPLQDWMSIDVDLRREKPEEERINIPAIAQHYWRYRMHVTLEQLLLDAGFNEELRLMIEASGRD